MEGATVRVTKVVFADSYIRQADKMAAEAEQFAEFHRMRGEEAWDVGGPGKRGMR